MRRLLLAVLLACALPAAHAGLFDKNPADSASDAARANMQALSKAHNAFASHGYKVQSVQPYIENGDLQGFFVTYQKP